MGSFSYMRMAQDIGITFVVRTEQVQAQSLRGLFGRLHNIKRMDMFGQNEGILRTPAVIKIWRDQNFDCLSCRCWSRRWGIGAFGQATDPLTLKTAAPRSEPGR
jgi:hypothetical protein